MTLKFLTLNIWHGGRRMDAIIDFLKQQDADIVCLQEVYNGSSSRLASRFKSIETLQKHLKYKSQGFAPAIIAALDGGDAPGGNAVLSKFSIVGHEAMFFNGTLTKYNPYVRETDARNANLPRVLQHVTLDTPGGEVNVFNIHGIRDLDGNYFGAQRQGMRDTVLRAIEGKSNVILAGDTNAQPTNKAMTDIGQKLHSVFGNELKTTFDTSHKVNPGYATAPVDMIFVSDDVKILKKTCHQVVVSDHLPLTATLEVS